MIGGFKSKKEAINQALREFIQRHKQRELVGLSGKFPADADESSFGAVKVNKKITLEQKDEVFHRKGSDYTKERQQWLGNPTLEEIRADILRLKQDPSNPLRQKAKP